MRRCRHQPERGPPHEKGRRHQVVFDVPNQRREVKSDQPHVVGERHPAQANVGCIETVCLRRWRECWSAGSGASARRPSVRWSSRTNIAQKQCHRRLPDRFCPASRSLRCGREKPSRDGCVRSRPTGRSPRHKRSAARKSPNPCKRMAGAVCPAREKISTGARRSCRARSGRE